MIIGAVVGITAGYFGGKIDTVLNFFTNWFLVIPWIALAIVLVVAVGPEPAQHHHGHRDHVVGRHGPTDPLRRR